MIQGAIIIKFSDGNPELLLVADNDLQARRLARWMDKNLCRQVETQSTMDSGPEPESAGTLSGGDYGEPSS